MREISHFSSLSFFNLPVFLCTSHSVGTGGHTFLHLCLLEVLYDKYHSILYDTVCFFQGRKKLVICSVSQCVSYNARKEHVLFACCLEATGNSLLLNENFTLVKIMYTKICSIY